MTTDDATEGDNVYVLSEKIIERFSAGVLAVAALATSWGGYQGTLWNGNQLDLMARAQKNLQCGSRAFTTAGQQRTIDVITFSSWLAARAAREERLMHFYEQRFRPELRTAFAAWMASRPMENPNAAPVPFLMPEYRLAADDSAARCDAESMRAFSEANTANTVGDRYMFVTVVFAISLFFAGGMPSLEVRRLRGAMLGIAVIALVAGLLLLARLPSA